MIGAGGISRVHAPAWKALGVPVLVYSEEGAQDLAQEYGLEAVSSLDELMERSSIVDIVTPTSTHKALALAAIAAGRHVICEKPLALTSREALEMATAARAAGVSIYPAHVVRFTAPYAAAQAAVEAGRIGEVAVARFHREGTSPAPESWFHDEAASGGIVMDLMIHDLDQARWMCGEVERVYAVQYPPTLDNTVPTLVSAHVTLTHTGGAVSHVRANWSPPGTRFKTGFSIAGSKGTLNYSSVENTGISVELQEEDETDSIIPTSALRESPYLTEIRELLQAIDPGHQPSRVNADDGIAAVRIAEAARESLRSGQAVSLDPGFPTGGSTPSPVLTGEGAFQ